MAVGQLPNLISRWVDEQYNSQQEQVHQGENENQLTTEEETPNWNDWHEQQRQRFQQQVKAWKEKVTTFQDQFKNQMQMQQQTWQNKPGQGQQSWSSWSSW